MVSVTWTFGIPRFNELVFDISILNEPDNDDGLFLQLYEGRINAVPFYFGIQTDIIHPELGFVGRGFLASRWHTQDLENTRPIEGGWTEIGRELGKEFVGIRSRYNWATHRYRLSLRFIENDEIGDWYGIWIEDVDTDVTEFKGALRFPDVPDNQRGIADGGTSWIELYYRRNDTRPNWHIAINGVQATEDMSSPIEVSSDWSENVVYLEGDVVHLIESEMGSNIGQKRVIFRAE